MRLDPVRTECLAKAVDVDLERLRGRPRRSPAPELVDQALPGDDLVGAQQQDGRECALLRRTEPDRTVIYDGLNRPEQAEFRSSTPLKQTPSES